MGYCRHVQGSDLVLEGCDISSSTGSGVGIEGGSPMARDCAVHDCERHGIAVFSELGGSAGASQSFQRMLLAAKISVGWQHAWSRWLLFIDHRAQFWVSMRVLGG